MSDYLNKTILKKYDKILLVMSTLLIISSILLGAFGSHILENILEIKYMNIYNIAIKYHFYNTLSLFILNIFYILLKLRIIFISNIILLIGSIIFSGSLYLLVYTKLSFWGMITPIGGVLLVIAWITFIIGVIRSDKI
jgi:uncharacterized membrane protein YgdD (TMEM256/DUF423 family)